MNVRASVMIGSGMSPRTASTAGRRGSAAGSVRYRAGIRGRASRRPRRAPARRARPAAGDPAGQGRAAGPGCRRRRRHRPQRLDLRLVGPAAVDGRHRQLALAGGQVLRGGGEVAGHLQAQFAGGHHDQRPRDAGQLARGVGGDALQQGYAEGVGLAHAGAGLTDQVVAGQRQRQSQFLDGKCVLDAIFGQCAHYFVANSEFGKCWVQCSHAGWT